jgi:hypothetical protein
MPGWLTSGHAERLAALDMIQHVADGLRAITLGADRGYDASTSSRNCAPSMFARMARNTSGRRSAIDAADNVTRLCREPAHPQRIEEAFG